MKKLNRKGFTMAEMLIAVAILAIFVSMAAVGTSALFGTGEQMMAASKAAVLGADVMDVISNEFRFGENFSVAADGLSVEYDSASYGDSCSMKLNGGHLVIVRSETVKDENNIEKTEETEYLPLGTVAYDEVTIGTLTFGQNADTGALSVSISIVGTGGKSLWSNDTAIVPFYTKVTT